MSLEKKLGSFRTFSKLLIKNNAREVKNEVQNKSFENANERDQQSM